MEINEWVREARKHKGWTQQQLGDAVGRTKANVGHWETGKHAPSLALIQAISLATDYPMPVLGVAPGIARLASELARSSSEVRGAALGSRPIPLISDIAAGLLREIVDPFQPGDAHDWLYTDADVSTGAFALEITGLSMVPDFRPGDRVIIDPALAPQPGDFVVARNGEREATFKKYRPRGMNERGNVVFELVPLNEDYPTLRSDVTPLLVIGTMVEHRQYRRR